MTAVLVKRFLFSKNYEIPSFLTGVFLKKNDKQLQLSVTYKPNIRLKSVLCVFYEATASRKVKT